MANEKMTKRGMFEQLKSKYPLSEDEVAFINHELELLAKKSSAERKPSARQIENEVIMGFIVAEMAPNTLYTIGEMMKQFSCFSEDMTSQRVSALVSKLVESGKLVREMDKRKAYFRLA